MRVDDKFNVQTDNHTSELIARFEVEVEITESNVGSGLSVRKWIFFFVGIEFSC